MKKRILTITTSLLMLIPLFTIGQEKPLVWDYPVKPGTEEWKTLISHEDMLRVCQIPDDILQAMSTKDLIFVCLNYPLQFDFFAHNNLQEGLRKVSANFNGIQELFKRNDNALYLLDLLRNNNLETLPNKNTSDLQRGEAIVKLSLTEVLLSQEEVLTNATLDQHKEIAAIAVKNMTVKEQSPQMHSNYSLEASAYLLGVSLKKIDKEIVLSPELDMFLKTGALQDKTQLETLRQNYSKILKK